MVLSKARFLAITQGFAQINKLILPATTDHSGHIAF